MIKIHLAPMSDELRARYEEKVRTPGQRWLAANPVSPGSKKVRPEDYWRKIKIDLAKAYHLRCAFTAMWLNHDGTVDHFISIDEDRAKAYEWDNFRYCAGWFNSKKQHATSKQLIDPLDVEDGWFEISWPDLQLLVTDQCPENLRGRAEFMLEKLELRKGATVMANRATYAEMYREDKEKALPFIEREAPLIARAIRKHLAQEATTGSDRSLL